MHSHRKVSVMSVRFSDFDKYADYALVCTILFGLTETSWCENNDTCINQNGKCIDRGNDFYCNCSFGFKGKRCGEREFHLL